MVIDNKFWSDRSVFITGHTGFKGGWLSFWLSQMGAKVHGYSLESPTTPNFFTICNLEKNLESSTIGNILDFHDLHSALDQRSPEVVFHLAAQPLVKKSYSSPLTTLETNVIGTANIMEACRSVPSIKAIVNITTDKCYENKEWTWPYRENDRLGGRDPYSASKACAEITAAAYRDSFLAEANIHLASVRAGNVIGGGDWAADRLIPDFLRALDIGEILTIRSPNAVRPWQHVLEPLSGYLMLAEKLFIEGKAFAEAWNFGPNDDDAKSVGWIVNQLCDRTPGAKWQTENAKHPHEAGLLKLDSSKAKTKLVWNPRWNLEIALNKTIEWHQAWRKGNDMAAFTSSQLQAYTNT
ncbi:CDP-glucose 4,6-dehydratase [Opitutales bacterium]|nr:CDP-glucose 4,6-dehydratase [Opitutales bacterium]